MSDCFRKIESGGTASTRIYELIELTYNEIFSPIALALNATIVKLAKDGFTYKENVIYSENNEKIDVYYKFTRMK